MVGYMRRFAPAFLEAVERLPSLGRINFARVHDVIGRNRLIVDQTAYVVRPDDLDRAALEERWDRGRRLVADAIGDVPPAAGRRVPAALRAGQPRPVGDARAARPARRACTPPGSGATAATSPRCSTTATTSSPTRPASTTSCGSTPTSRSTATGQPAGAVRHPVRPAPADHPGRGGDRRRRAHPERPPAPPEGPLHPRAGVLPRHGHARAGRPRPVPRTSSRTSTCSPS